MASLSTKLIACALMISIFLAHVAAASATGCPTTPEPKKPAPAPKKPSPALQPPPAKACPKDTLKLGACADVLGAVSALVGSPPSSKCCAVLEGLADLEAALCLCTAIKANILGININIPIALSVIVSACQKTVPPEFKCE